MTAPVVDTLELGPLGTNCYLARAGRGASEAVVVDPSGSPGEIRLQLAHMGARCAAILVTHCHWDHFLGLAELAEGTGAPVWLPRDEERVFRHPGEVYGADGIAVSPFEGEATLVGGGEAVVAGGIAFEVIAVPGHSPGHVAYATPGCVFAGDVLFAGSVGRTDLPGGDWPTLLASIGDLADRLADDTVVYPGHGPATTIGRELAHNPFLAELRSGRPAPD